jgi:hypothetical protein
MPPVGFEPIISAGERPKTYALDRAAPMGLAVVVVVVVNVIVITAVVLVI